MRLRRFVRILASSILLVVLIPNAASAPRTWPSTIVALRGGGTTDFWALDADHWEAMPRTPAPVGPGGALTQLWRFGYVYAFRGDGRPDFWRIEMNTHAPAWREVAPAPGPVGAGGALAGTNWGGLPYDFVYALQGGGSRAVWAYDANRDSWQHLTDAPGPVSAGAALAISSHTYERRVILTVMLGGSSSRIWQYRSFNHQWVPIDDIGAAGPGGSMSLLFSSCYFVFLGRGSRQFLAVADPQGPQWCPEAGVLHAAPQPVGAGGALVAAIHWDISTDDFVYALRGDATRDFWRWRRSTNTWEILPQVPYAIADGGAILEVPYDVGGPPLPVRPTAWKDLKRTYR